MSFNYLQNNCVCLPQYSSIQTPIGSKHIKEPQTSMSLWAGGTGVCSKLMTVCMHVSVTAITFPDGRNPPSLSSLSLSLSLWSPPYRDRAPWAKVLPQNCLQPSPDPTIYRHLPSELHATDQAPADTQRRLRTQRATPMPLDCKQSME